MKPVTQSRVDEDGTCFRACIASILEVPEKRIPDFGASGDDETWWADVQAWLNKAGYTYRRVPIDGTKPVGYSTIEGLSPRGGLHACVAKDGVLVHDPHPQDGTGRGLVEPRYYGLFEPVTSKARDTDDVVAKIAALKPNQHVKINGVYIYHKGKGAFPYRIAATINPDGGYQDAATPSSAANKLRSPAWRHFAKKATDRADMLQLRKNTAKQGGPFLIQVTEKNGKEHTVPTRGARL